MQAKAREHAGHPTAPLARSPDGNGAKCCLSAHHRLVKDHHQPEAGELICPVIVRTAADGQAHHIVEFPLA